jgi:hypothetical protein
VELFYNFFVLLLFLNNRKIRMKQALTALIFTLLSLFALGQTPNKALTMANNVNEMNSWDKYPVYEVYDSMMRGFLQQYPQFCRLDTIGVTTEGRLLLALKISDNVNVTENEPKFFYSSSMHGDEVTGMVMLLRLASYLLNNATESRIANIINRLELFICPMANPDGTYASGNNTLGEYISTRQNANYVDLNRNFPSPKAGQHPDGEATQIETQAFMDYAKANQFDININLHGGAEVCNYPFDNKLPSNNISHADNQWFVDVCQQFIDTLRLYAPANYFTDVTNSGYILGYDWYAISGSRQDYHTYFLRQREITLEISSNKSPFASMLPTYWNRLRSPLLCFVEQCLQGADGVVKDSITGETLDSVLITIAEHDRDNSEVYSKTGGYYFRPLHEGSYSLIFTKQGYQTKTLNITLSPYDLLTTDVYLVKEVSLAEEVKENGFLEIYPNPSTSQITAQTNGDGIFFIINTIGKRLKEGTLHQGSNLIELKEGWKNGIYFFVFTNRTTGETIIKQLIIKDK